MRQGTIGQAPDMDFFPPAEFTSMDIVASLLNAPQKILFGLTTGWGLEPHLNPVEVAFCQDILLGILLSTQ